jgi:hypothetical protein
MKAKNIQAVLIVVVLISVFVRTAPPRRISTPRER